MVTHEAGNPSETLECYSFTLILSGFDELTGEIEDALYNAGCNDALLGLLAGTPYLAFDRYAESLEQAIQTAIKHVETCGLPIEVVRVIPPGADTMETVNAYLQLRRQLTRCSKAVDPQVAHQLDEFFAAISANNPEVPQ